MLVRCIFRERTNGWRTNVGSAVGGSPVERIAPKMQVFRRKWLLFSRFTGPIGPSFWVF